MSHNFEPIEKELWSHYETVEGDEDWYRCIHCNQKVYYHPKKPSDLTRHIPDEIFWTSDDSDGCRERLKIEQDG